MLQAIRTSEKVTPYLVMLERVQAKVAALPEVHRAQAAVATAETALATARTNQKTFLAVPLAESKLRDAKKALERAETGAGNREWRESYPAGTNYIDAYWPDSDGGAWVWLATLVTDLPEWSRAAITEALKRLALEGIVEGHDDQPPYKALAVRFTKRGAQLEALDDALAAADRGAA